MSSSKSTLYWRGFNIASRAILRRYPGQSMLLRYEDFIADPAGTVAGLMRLAGADPAGNPVSGHTVQLHTNHTVTGNPDRFRTGQTVIRDSDDRWRRSLGKPARLAAMLLSWPMSWRYGYRHPGGLLGRTSADRAPTDHHQQPAVATQREDGTVGSGS